LCSLINILDCLSSSVTDDDTGIFFLMLLLYCPYSKRNCVHSS